MVGGVYPIIPTQVAWWERYTPIHHPGIAGCTPPYTPPGDSRVYIPLYYTSLHTLGIPPILPVHPSTTTRVSGVLRCWLTEPWAQL